MSAPEAASNSAHHSPERAAHLMHEETRLHSSAHRAAAPPRPQHVDLIEA